MGLVVFHLVVALLGSLFKSATRSANLNSTSNNCSHHHHHHQYHHHHHQQAPVHHYHPHYHDQQNKDLHRKLFTAGVSNELARLFLHVPEAPSNIKTANIIVANYLFLPQGEYEVCGPG